MALKIERLTAGVDGKSILEGVDLQVPFGEVHAIMGPNGSGKSTLCHVLTGKEGYTVSGAASLDGHDLLTLDVAERARLGLLLSFQYPTEVPGVRLREFMLEAAEEKGIPAVEAERRIEEEAKRFDMIRFLDRSLNDELSGGEKKRSEIFQMAVLRPKVALLDEIDSGLDIDAVRQVSGAVEQMRSPELGVVMITHYNRILKYLTPDRVHIMIDGRIVDSGGPELANELESGGYDLVRQRLGLKTAVTTPERRPADFFTDTPFDV
jgi:Fe-S cluster assembly ATP-binding protein